MTLLSNWETLARLLVAAVLGSLVGFERERLLWAAGIRTHMLVCVGACLFMIVSAFGFADSLSAQHVVLDPSRVAAQVVSGIGFLGAGAILARGNGDRSWTSSKGGSTPWRKKPTSSRSSRPRGPCDGSDPTPCPTS